nr:hypothetical protein [Tanacetum cinerariifolium]
MANLPPPVQAADLPDDEPVNPEPTHEPIKQVVPEQNNMDGFALHMNPQPAGNMNRWLIEDDDEEVEDGVDNVDDEDDKELNVDEEDEYNGVDDNEDEAEVINAYEEVDPLNRPPPTSDEETEYAPPVVSIDDVKNEPIPHVIQFIHNIHVGEGSSAGALLAGNNEVNVPDPISCNLESVPRVAARLDKKFFDRYRTEKKMAKKFKEDEFRMNDHEYDITALDAAVRKNSSEHSEIKKTMPPRRRSQTNPQPLLNQKAVNQLVRDGIEAAIRAERERVIEEATRAGGAAGGPAAAPVATLGLEVENENPWTEVKKMMIDEFCPIKECPDAVPNEKKKVELYIKGLPEVIKGETTSSRHAMLNDAVRMAHTLMEQKIQAKNERVAKGNKRRWENNNQGGNNNRNNNNRNNNNRGPAPKCNRCGLRHFGNCLAKCTKCNKMGHKAKDCRVRGLATGVNALPIRACYECRERNHDRSRCPKLADQRGGNATGRAYDLEMSSKVKDRMLSLLGLGRITCGICECDGWERVRYGRVQGGWLGKMYSEGKQGGKVDTTQPVIGTSVLEGMETGNTLTLTGENNTRVSAPNNIRDSLASPSFENPNDVNLTDQLGN